jgi:DNA-binding NtrC family response regulator
MNVVFVGDDQDTFLTIKELIEKYFLNVKVTQRTCPASLAQEQLIKGNRLFLLDLDSCGMFVVEAIERLARIANSKLVVLGSTQHGTIRFEKALKIGAVDYVLKPILESRLVSVVVSHLKGAIPCSSSFCS